MTQMNLIDLTQAFSCAVLPGTPGMGIYPENHRENAENAEGPQKCNFSFLPISDRANDGTLYET